MHWINSVLVQLTSYIQPFYSEIALTMLATLMVIYGDLLNKQVKAIVRPYHFMIRTTVFVLVCAFGYGLLLVFATPLVKQLIFLVPQVYRGLSIILVFLLLGYLAEHRRYI